MTVHIFLSLSLVLSDAEAIFLTQAFWLSSAPRPVREALPVEHSDRRAACVAPVPSVPARVVPDHVHLSVRWVGEVGAPHRGTAGMRFRVGRVAGMRFRGFGIGVVGVVTGMRFRGFGIGVVGVVAGMRF